MFNVLSSNLPKNIKSGLKRTSRRKANPELSKLRRELQKLERAMDRLKHLYIYSEDSMSEREYLLERNRITEAYKEAEARIEEISSYDTIEHSISDEDFIREATSFILTKKLSGNSYINYRRLAVSTDTQILKDFFNSVLDSITINTDGKIGSIVFKNGLRHRFIYKEEAPNG